MITANDVGPIARKIIAAGRKQQRQQIVDLQACAERVTRCAGSSTRRSHRATLAISIPGLQRINEDRQFVDVGG